VTPDPVIVRGVEPPCAQTDSLIDGNDGEPAKGEPPKPLLDLRYRPPLVSGDGVQYLGEVDRADQRSIGLVPQ
jgi:hypothetical protein